MLLTEYELDRILNEELSPQLRRFAEEYQTDLNAGAAAKRSGFSRFSNPIGIIANNRALKKYLDHLAETRRIENEALLERVILELTYLSFSDITDTLEQRDPTTAEQLANPTATRIIAVKDLNDMPPEVRRTISAITYNATKSEITIKQIDKTKPLEMLGRYLGMFTDKNDLKGAAKELPAAVNNFFINHRSGDKIETLDV